MIQIRDWRSKGSAGRISKTTVCFIFCTVLMPSCFIFHLLLYSLYISDLGVSCSPKLSLLSIFVSFCLTLLHPFCHISPLSPSPNRIVSSLRETCSLSPAPFLCTMSPSSLQRQ